MRNFFNNFNNPDNVRNEQYRILKDIGSPDSPAVAAVMNLQKAAGLLSPSPFSNVETDPMKVMRNAFREEKDLSAYASSAVLTNSNIAHDVESRHKLKKVFHKPSEYINGFHVDEIRQQHKLLKEFERNSNMNHDMTCVTPPGKVTPKAVARSYRNNLDTEFTRDEWLSESKPRKRTNMYDETTDDDRNFDTKPKFDWIQAVRTECLKQMKLSKDKENTRKVVELFKCIGRKEPKELFHDIQTVWETSSSSKYSLEETVQLMMAFIN